MTHAVVKRVPELAAACAAVAVYLPTLGYDLVFDDTALIGPDGPYPLGNGWLPYRPLRFASLWLDHLLAPESPVMYHATNVSLHAIAAVLCVRLARRFGADAMAAALAGVLFAVHPLAVESVAYVAGRRDLLSLVFGLAALLAWTSPRGRSALAIVLVLAGVASKESAILFLPVLCAASLCGFGPSLRLASGSLVMTAAAALALPVAYGAIGPLAPAGGLLPTLALGGRLATHYLGGLLLPVGLSVEYPYLVCGGDCGDFDDTRTLLGLVLLFGVSLVASTRVVQRLRAGRGGRRALLAADPVGLIIAWLAVTLVPLALVIGMHEPGADRHAYPLLATASIAVAVIAERLSSDARLPAAVASVLVVGLLAFVTRGQAAIWRNAETLWSQSVRTAPDSARVHHNLAGVLIESGRLVAARRHLKTALRIQPEYGPAHLGLAWVACRRGRKQATLARLASARALGAEPDTVAAVEDACAVDSEQGSGRKYSR